MDYQTKSSEARAQHREAYQAYVNRRALYSKTFGSESGRKVFEDMMAKSYMFSSTFTGNSMGQLREGERNRILEIMSVIPGIAGEVIHEWCRKQEEIINADIAAQRKELDND